MGYLKMAGLGVAAPALACALALAPPARSQGGAAPPESAAAKAHVDAAMAIAGADLADDARAMCRAGGEDGEPRPPRASAAPGAPLRGSEPYPPVKLADNFYYFGRQAIGSHALVTSDGIILIDAINNGQDVEEAIIGGMKSVGLDPKQIKWLIITHDHGDHYGGAQYLRDKYGVRIAEGAADWDGPGQERGPPGWVPLGPKAKRQPGDLYVQDHGKLTLGDTTVTLVVTPGHTPGTLSLLYPVKIGGKPYTAMQWGGGQPTNYNPQAVRRFVNDFAKPQKAALQFGSHPMGDLPKMEQLQANPGMPNPFLEGPETFGRRLDIILECNAAAAARKAPG